MIGNDRPLGVSHHLEEEVVDPSLVQYDVGHLGKPVLNVLDAVAAPDLVRRVGIRLPEHRFVDPVGLVQHLVSKTERVEHLNAAAGDAVGLPDRERTRFCLDQGYGDVGKGGQLGGQRQAGRPGPDDEHVNLGR